MSRDRAELRTVGPKGPMDRRPVSWTRSRPSALIAERGNLADLNGALGNSAQPIALGPLRGSILQIPSDGRGPRKCFQSKLSIQSRIGLGPAKRLRRKAGARYIIPGRSTDETISRKYSAVLSNRLPLLRRLIFTITALTSLRSVRAPLNPKPPK